MTNNQQFYMYIQKQRWQKKKQYIHDKLKNSIQKTNSIEKNHMSPTTSYINQSVQKIKLPTSTSLDTFLKKKLHTL